MIQRSEVTGPTLVHRVGGSKPRYNAAIKPTDLTAGQAGLGQIEIALNAAQCIIIDDALVAQMDDRFAFGIERFLLEPLILRSRDFAAAFIRIVRAKFQLLDALVVFGTQSVDRILRKFAIRGELLE